jgi:transglutaminase-like putative cysteine protease
VDESVMDEPVWQVACRLEFDVTADATVVLQISPAVQAGTILGERFEVAVDGRSLPVTRLDGDHGGVLHVVRSPPGELTVDMETMVDRSAPVEAPRTTTLDVEQLTYLRQSRYCPSDRLAGFAAYEFGHLDPGPELLLAVGDWVASRLTYEEGFSGPLDSAVDSLFAGRGVCRDFAHLAITLLRGLDVPARMVAVYAPGLFPMDFHAVVEAHVDGCWRVLDATRLAPRQSLLRVSTGRDAADTAFITVLGGAAELRYAQVGSVTDGDLPVDDHTTLVSLA